MIRAKIFCHKFLLWFVQRRGLSWLVCEENVDLDSSAGCVLSKGILVHCGSMNDFTFKINIEYHEKPI